MDHIISIPKIILLLMLAILSFFFSASETSVIGLSKIKLRHMVAKGIKRAKTIQRLTASLDRFIVAILVGNNFVNIAISSIVTAICVQIFGFNWGVFIATFVTAMLVLIFCEITPKIIAIKHQEKMALFTAPLMEGFISIFRTFISIFIGISNLILKILRIGPAKRSPLITEEELRLMIELGKEEGFLSDEEAKLLQKIFEFGDITVGDIMVPREKMTAIDIKSTSEDLLNIFVEQGHSRLPVYSEKPDNVVGVIYARDLLYILRDKGLFLLQDLIHEVHFVTEKTRVNELLKTFQQEKIQIAIVADSHKRALGMVTLEDLIEEIVGEIEEAHIRHKK